MENLDSIKNNFRDSFSAALQSNDEGAITDALSNFAADMQKSILNDVSNLQQANDNAILAKRGVACMTSEETKFWQSVCDALKGGAKMALTGTDAILPVTFVTSVVDEIQKQFPLLAAIPGMTVTAVTKIIVNTQTAQLVTWGAFGSTTAQELSGAFKEIDLTACKLLAKLPVSQDLIEAGPTWIDAYCRAILVEAAGIGLCNGIINGTGKDMPIGMTKDVSATAAVTNGVYPDKAVTTLTDLSPKSFGAICATLATDGSGRARAVPEVVLICNPVDYFNKIMPASTIQRTDGTYSNNAFPYPTMVVQDTNVASGKAIFGLASRYFLGLTVGGTSGKLLYDDSEEFSEDVRMYKIKLLANGRPLDNNAFVVADISGLEEAALPVKVKGTVTTKASA